MGMSANVFSLATKCVVSQSCIVMLAIHATKRDHPPPSSMVQEARDAIAGNWDRLHPERRVAIREFIEADISDRRYCAKCVHGDPAYYDRISREADEWEAWLAMLPMGPFE
jgi:hypothetical protein